MKIRKRFYILPIIIGIVLIASINVYTYFAVKHAESAAQAELDEYNKMNNKLPQMNMEIKDGVVVVSERKE